MHLHKCGVWFLLAAASVTAAACTEVLKCKWRAGKAALQWHCSLKAAAEALKPLSAERSGFSKVCFLAVNTIFLENSTLIINIPINDVSS